MKQRHHFSILLLLALVTACGLQAPEFVEHEFDGYAIALPLPQPVIRSEEGPDGKISSVSAEVNGTKYLVVYWEIPLYLRGVSDAEILESMSLGAGAWKVMKQDKVTIAGIPGTEIEGKSATGKHMITRMVRTRDRVYLLTAGGGASSPARKNVDRFFDSFRLLQ
ncbi:MAG: hypothetical protein ACRESK_01855 [Gammaproteobacteria bacterium]